uniref:ABC transporter n=1 Tax=uncultured euryarchaeote Alv-FOS1 TaxID=337892 RepID=Q3SAD6_9EURY|nr:ABC transporter [uncultured euryarchaeote Alv-FOS1]
MAFIEVQDISKTFGTRKVLDRASMAVKRGDIVLVEGPSGIGKSTLLHIIAGIDEPNAGTVIIDDTNIFSLNEDRRAKFRLEKMGIIFQQMNLIDDLTVEENIALPLKLAGKKWRKRVDELVEYLKIEEVRHSLPSSISGGELQRCAIARALANEPEILIADEPTSNLDNQNTENIGKLFLKINSEMNVTLIIATHDPRIEFIGGRRFELREGRINER